MQKSLFAEQYCCEIRINTMTVREATGPQCCDPEAIAKLFKGVEAMAQEGFFLVTLDAKHKVIDKRLITLGTLNSSFVHPREAFRPAIMDAACAVIFAHNHPSGDTTPSKQDKELTERLKKCGELLGITVLDHIIIGRDKIYSFTLDEVICK